MLVPEHNTAPDGVTPVRLQPAHAAVPVSRWAGVSNSALTQSVRDVLVLIICSNARHGHGHQPLSRSCHVCIGPACGTPAFLFGLRSHDGVIQLISWVLWPASAHIKLLGMRAHPAMLGWPGLTDPGLMRKRYFLSLFASFSVRLHAHACACQLSRRQAYEAPIHVVEGTRSRRVLHLRKGSEHWKRHHWGQVSCAVHALVHCRAGKKQRECRGCTVSSER